MAYNRTLQQAGKAHQVKPMEEWIVSVGKHKGVVTGKKWIKVQNLLEVNKSKSYRKPRSNVALLSGLLFCKNCGDYMRPKLSNRVNANGDTIYTYLCTTKERSRGHCCSMKNANGNMLDAKLMSVLAELSKNNSDMFRQLDQGKKVLRGNCEGYGTELTKLKDQVAQNDTEIHGLVTTLAKLSGTPTEAYVVKQIDELHEKGEALRKRIADMEALTARHALADYEFEILKEVLYSFHSQIDTMTVEQKRNALRMVVKKVVWDGENAHVYLMTDPDEDDPELPEPIPSGGVMDVLRSDDEESPLSEDSE